MVFCLLLNTLSVANIADKGVSMEHWQKYSDRGKSSARRKTCFSVTLSTTNLMCNGRGLKLDLSGEGLANNCLTHRLALKIMTFQLISLTRRLIELILIIQELKKNDISEDRIYRL
jgi:hypothetical protein